MYQSDDQSVLLVTSSSASPTHSEVSPPAALPPSFFRGIPLLLWCHFPVHLCYSNPNWDGKSSSRRGPSAEAHPKALHTIEPQDGPRTMRNGPEPLDHVETGWRVRHSKMKFSDFVITAVAYVILASCKFACVLLQKHRQHDAIF